MTVFPIPLVDPTQLLGEMLFIEPKLSSFEAHFFSLIVMPILVQMGAIGVDIICLLRVEIPVIVFCAVSFGTGTSTIVHRCPHGCHRNHLWRIITRGTGIVKGLSLDNNPVWFSDAKPRGPAAAGGEGAADPSPCSGLVLDQLGLCPSSLRAAPHDGSCPRPAGERCSLRPL